MASSGFAAIICRPLGAQFMADDVIALFEFEDSADLFDLTGLSLYLEEELHRKVDVVPKRALREELRESVLREVIAVRETTRCT